MLNSLKSGNPMRQIKKDRFTLLIIFCFLSIGLGHLSQAQQNDSTKVLFSSDGFPDDWEVKNPKNRKGINIQLRDSAYTRSIWSVRYRPYGQTRVRLSNSVNPFAFFNVPEPEWKYGHGLMLAYERLIGESGLSIRLESNTRLYSLSRGHTYQVPVDYYTQFAFINTIGIQDENRLDYDTHLSAIDISFRYYYRLKRRREDGLSGLNPFNTYVYLRFKDVASLTRITTFEFDQAHFLGIDDETRLLIEPSYVFFGWGIQKRFFNLLVAETHFGLGTKVNGKIKREWVRDTVIDFTVSVGIVLFKDQSND